MLTVDTVQLQSKTKKNTDVLKEFVKLVLHNVLNVLKPLIIVISVFKEESMPQNVTVQMVNTLMLTINAKTVMSNVKLVLLMKSVLNVLKMLTELPQKNVNVMLDIMMLMLLSVHNVTTIVLNVSPIQVVPSVLKEEKTFQIVYACSIVMITVVIVNHVLTNVKDVVNHFLHVGNVLVKTELMFQLVIVCPDIGKMDSLKLVQNVLANVTLVLTVVLIV